MMRRRLALALPLALAGCGGGGSTPTATAPAVQRAESYDVLPCFNQVIPGTGGETVAQAVLPDELTIDLTRASGFPNGRRLTDPVIDITLAAIFVNLAKNGADAFLRIPLNPTANDVPFRATFPYLAPPQGAPPLSGTGGTSFDFRSDPPSAYVQVDRMGMPAVATTLIASPVKSAYNDGSPADDAAGFYVPDLRAHLLELTDVLADDVTALGLTTCAVKE